MREGRYCISSRSFSPICRALSLTVKVWKQQKCCRNEKVGPFADKDAGHAVNSKQKGKKFVSPATSVPANSQEKYICCSTTSLRARSTRASTCSKVKCIAREARNGTIRL